MRCWFINVGKSGEGQGRGEGKGGSGGVTFAWTQHKGLFARGENVIIQIILSRLFSENSKKVLVIASKSNRFESDGKKCSYQPWGKNEKERGGGIYLEL